MTPHLEDSLIYHHSEKLGTLPSPTAKQQHCISDNPLSQAALLR